MTARLLARGGFEVTLHERLDPAATYGFGVALAGQALKRLAEHDPDAAARIEPLCHPLRRWTMRRENDSASIEDRGASGIERSGLLRTLQDLAAEAGARIQAGSEASIEEVAAGADVVVLADGVGSHGRDALAARLGASVETVPIPYMWCGAEIDLDAMTLFLRRDENGIYCGHVMPYGGGRCTFQVDTVPGALDAAGLAENQGEGNSGSDEESLTYLSELFAPLLGTRRLLGNRSRWSSFRLVTCDRWSDGNIVLLGDAAHTAHYTVGSGTRMAMEDAIVLSLALIGEGSLESAFAAYEAERRPAVEHLQWRAFRSQTWWRTIAHRYDLPLPVLLFSYFTRTGSVGLERLSRSNPEIVEAAVEHGHRDRVIAGVDTNGTPAAVAGAHLRDMLAGRVVDPACIGDSFVEAPCDGVAPWSDDSLAVVRGLDGGLRRGVLLTGASGRRSLLDRFDVAEELRSLTEGPVAVAVPADLLDDAATAIAAGRADYVMVEDR
ncbi:MAG: FAD-dependent monooxygenase [Actinobacteria bacterium]|nr:FAD-dependent monooxygenase [Actinomycetota bacterium]